MAEAAMNFAMLNGGLRFAAIERQVFHVCVILKQLRLLGACNRVLPVFMSHGHGVISGVVKHEDVSLPHVPRQLDPFDPFVDSGHARL